MGLLRAHLPSPKVSANQRARRKRPSGRANPRWHLLFKLRTGLSDSSRGCGAAKANYLSWGRGHRPWPTADAFTDERPLKRRPYLGG